MIRISLLIILTCFGTAHAQTGIVSGKITAIPSGEPIGFAEVRLTEDTLKVVLSDIDGNYRIENLQPGLQSITVKATGYQSYTQAEIMVSSSRIATVDIQLSEKTNELKSVEVKAAAFEMKRESPVGYQTLGRAEIERYPGGNRDVSKVIRSLPGVASPPGFRNDIIIRGGSPGENKFYIDGIEVPTINHFATQGSSGGPVGLINVNFIEDVEFYSGAFPANRGNATSSIFEFRQKSGNPERMIAGMALGSSDLALNLDGPLGKKTDMILSVRRSYLQFLFAALKLPFLPTYNDAQFRVGIKMNEKNKLTITGLGAIDQFALNTKVNEGITDAEVLERNNYILGGLPAQTQWNYTLGANYQRNFKAGFQNLVISRSHLNNRSKKFRNNDESDADNLILDYRSQEIENKLRFEHNWFKRNIKINAGAGYEYVTYLNDTYNKVLTSAGITEIDYSSNLNINKFSVFTQASGSFFQNKLRWSAGIRTDANDFSSSTANPVNQISPRASISYVINDRFTVGANAGRYYQLPAYTILGYRNTEGTLINKQNNVSFIGVNHYVAGVSWLPGALSKVSIEGFYKEYSGYPFSTDDSLNLANLGADFGVIGNEPVKSIGAGRSYGVELLARQKMIKGFYGILAYTWVRSEFKDKNDMYVPSAWDSRHIVSLTGGKRFNKNWELGLRWLFSGGAPYTPFDIATSSLIQVWDITRQGIPDYDKLNTARNKAYHQLDVRVDKRWYLKKWTLNLYIDIQNIYGYNAQTAPFLNTVNDENGAPLLDSNDPSRYQVKLVENSTGTIVPTLGIIIEF